MAKEKATPPPSAGIAVAASDYTTTAGGAYWVQVLTQWQRTCDNELQGAIDWLQRAALMHPCAEAKEAARTALAFAQDALAYSAGFEAADEVSGVLAVRESSSVRMASGEGGDI